MSTSGPDLAQLAKNLRQRVPHVIDGEHLKRAAVAVVLRPIPNDLEVVLIRRTETPNDPWSGHMAFPGGTSEPEDADLLETATRETFEEVRLDLRSAELIGRLDDVQAIGRGRVMRLVISPYVFRLEGDPELVPNAEVDEIIWAPIGPMLSRKTETSFELEFEGDQFTMSGYQVGENIVWGLTYYMLEHLFAFMEGRPPPEDPRRRS